MIPPFFTQLTINCYFKFTSSSSARVFIKFFDFAYQVDILYAFKRFLIYFSLIIFAEFADI